MSVLLVLKLGYGSLSEGFPHVNLQLWESETSLPIQLTGSLPPDGELLGLYDRWRNLYEALASASGSRFRSIVFEEGEILQFSRSEFFQACEGLKERFNGWLNSPGFNRVEHTLRTHLRYQDSIRLIVETNNDALRGFPWQLWHFFEDYPCAEMALGPPEYRQIQSLNKRKKPRVLAILGNSVGIEVKHDRALLEGLSGVEVVFLVEPSRKEIDRLLWDEAGWDILFFAGHSSTEDGGKKGYLEINPQERMSLDGLKNALKGAIARGLGLAIFNSCDGLGLASQLAELSIPQIIVMREPVPDKVAQEFFKGFLSAFKNGRAFYGAVREAREKLQGLEDEYPCASWLPVICQNPAVSPFTWPVNTASTGQRRRFYPLLTCFSITVLIMGMRFLGWGLTWEITLFNRLLSLRAHEEQDTRILLVIATPEDMKAQPVPPTGKASLSDHTLASLLDKIQRYYKPTTIGIDIYRDFPATADSKLGAALKQDNVFGICKVRSSSDGDSEGIAPPPEMGQQQIAFADFVADSDRIVRRHLLSMNLSADPTDPCTAVNSFSFLLALHYLQTSQNIDFDYTGAGEIKIGNLVLKELDTYFGSYGVLDTGGRQILLNYRSLNSPQEIATTIELRDIIEDRIPPSRLSQLQGRIVLIGIADSPSTSADYWPTPFNNNKEIPGVFIQAQMVSQLISAVLDKRPLLVFLPWWLDFLWILASCLIAGGLYSLAKGRLGLIILLLSVTNLVFAYFLFLGGYIIPIVPLIVGLGLYGLSETTITKLKKL